MALHADTIWEIRTAGSDSNGGGWHDSGGASADHSQQDADNENWSNLSISGTTLTDADAGGKFTASMLGNIINIVTVGRFEIAVVTDTDNVEIDRAPGDAGGLTGYEGGAVATAEAIDDVVVADNTIHVKAGTYTASGQIYWSVSGTGSAPIKILGYNSSRGDNPTGSDRPLFDMGASYTFRTATYHQNENLRFQGSFTYVAESNGRNIWRNCSFHNSSGSAYLRALYSQTYDVVFDCEMVCDNGYGWYNVGDCALEGCLIHDTPRGIATGGGSSKILFSTIYNCSEYGISLASNGGMVVRNCNFYNCGVGIDWSSMNRALILNNQIVANTTGLRSTASGIMNLIDYNNYYNNTVDVDGVTKGAHATANNPGFANAPGGDFSGVDSADGFGSRLGVG